MNVVTGVQAMHRSRVEQMLAEAELMAGTATKIADVCRRALDQGGTVLIQPQMAYLTGSHARLMKDWGVVEQVQEAGYVVRRQMR